MANNPKKIVDPTEAALSAIQEALKIRGDEEQPDSEPEATPHTLGSAATDRWPEVPPTPTSDAQFDSGATAAGSGDAQALRAANDDQQSIGQILHALQHRPARASYVVAALFSFVWVIGCLALSWAYLGDLNAALGPGQAPR